MCWYEWNIARRDIVTPGFAWTFVHKHPKFKGWSIKYDVFTEHWSLQRIEPEKNGNESWLRYSIKCRKEFIDIISNCKEI